MNKLLLAGLLAASTLLFQACSTAGDTGTGTETNTGPTRGQKFSECLDTKSPDECDRIINRRSISY